MKDTFRHKGLRQILVDKIRKKGISNESVLNMINEIPRHLFLDNAFVQFAYQDKPFPIGAGQTISQPYTVAFQTQLLELNPYEKVLEVGTGSGYQAAVLIGMEANVYTIERQKELFQKTKEFLPELGYNCNFYYGDGYKGL
ncbi:MAG: protein-L-isoaspartate O-methyltransferase, partial [Flavobacteriales bacterium]|nr:protein-L-isoaspartate O-methyltransferase [Flavobacteriales bacterium]